MEGDAPQLLMTNPGYINSSTSFFYPQPQITGVNPLPLEIYISPDGSDAPGVVGSVTAPFATITNAIGYVNALPGAVTSTSVVCFFVAPGTYAGAVQLTDNMFLIGATINSTIPSLPTQVVNAVIISDLVTVTGNYSNDQPILIQNIQLDGGVRVNSVFFDTALNLVNCALRTADVSPALDIDPADQDVVSSVSARNCLFSTDSGDNLALVRAPDSEKTFLTFDGCQFSTYAEEGSIIEIIGSLTLNNCTLTNYQTGATLSPLIILASGTTLTAELVITNSTFKYTDVSTVDTGGDKLAIRFNAPTQPITASMTNCTVSIFLGDSQTNIVKNIGAQNVTLSQSANSCLSDGKTIDTTNIVLTAAHFLQDSPMPPGPGAGVESLNTLTGDITITGESGISIGAGEGNSLVISGSGVASLAGLTGAVTLSSPDASININVAGSDIELEAVIPAIPVASVGGKTGDITFSAGDGITIGYGENNAAPITITNSGVQQLSGVNGVITLSGTNVGITVADQNIDFAVSFPTPPVDSVGGKTGAITLAAGDGIAITYGANNAAPIDIANSGVLSVVAGTGITLTGDTPQNPTINANLPVYQATYYKSADQTLNGPNAPGNTDITFDLTGSWNNTGGYITHTDGTTSFTVVQTGVYFLEFNANINGAGVAWTGSKSVSIDVTRSPTAEQAVIEQTATINSGVTYGQSVSTTFYLVAGDVINLRIFNIYTSVTQPLARGLANTFDLNTFFSWRYISSGGASAYQNPPPVIQAAGTTALVPTSANTTYILTSGAGAQNFTTAGLGAGNAGLVWYIKNSKAGDNTIQHNGVAITGVTSVLHEKRVDTNTGSQILYWNGTDLIMY